MCALHCWGHPKLVDLFFIPHSGSDIMVDVRTCESGPVLKPLSKCSNHHNMIGLNNTKHGKRVLELVRNSAHVFFKASCNSST